jgi:hypothetical protein
MKKRIWLPVIYSLLLLPALGLSTRAVADWSAMESGTTYELRGVWGSAADDVIAVGIGGVIRHYDGNAEGSWSSMENSSP